MDRKEIKKDTGNRWGLGWDNENGDERDRHQSGLVKRYKEIEVDIQEIKRDSGR